MLRAIFCEQCGASLDVTNEGPITCTYCGTVHAVVRGPGAPREASEAQRAQAGTRPPEVDRAVGPLRCPHCRVGLVAASVRDITLEGCGRCGGIWLDNQSAGALIASPQRHVLELAQRCGANGQKTGLGRSSSPGCPRCGSVLELAQSHGLTLDVCAQHGTWFDSFELATLLGNLLRRKVGSTAPDGSSISCSSCRIAIDPKRANITESGPTCDACWRSTQSSMIAAAEEKHRSNVASAFALLLAAASAGSALSRASNRSR